MIHHFILTIWYRREWRFKKSNLLANKTITRDLSARFLFLCLFNNTLLLQSFLNKIRNKEAFKVVPLRSQDTPCYKCLPGLDLVWNLIICLSWSEYFEEDIATAPEGSLQSKTGNIISLVQQRTSMDRQLIVCPLEKEVELYRNFQKHRLKGKNHSQRLEMHNSIAPNHRKYISGSFESKTQIYEIGKLL